MESLIVLGKDSIEKELVYERKMASYKTEPTVFLTFDDGPIPEVTPYV